MLVFESDRKHGRIVIYHKAHPQDSQNYFGEIKKEAGREPVVYIPGPHACLSAEDLDKLKLHLQRAKSFNSTPV